jgi:hypothetical protein
VGCSSSSTSDSAFTRIPADSDNVRDCQRRRRHLYRHVRLRRRELQGSQRALIGRSQL